MDPARREPPHAAPRGAGFLRSSAASLLSGAVTVALGSAAHKLLTGTPRTLDAAVGGAVLGIGAAAAAMLAAGCLLLAVTAVRRVAGLTSRRLEALAAHLTPLVVRRALAVTISAGLGLGMAAGPAAATEPDTGWAVTTATSSTSVAAGPPTELTPLAEAPGHAVDLAAGTIGPAPDAAAPTAPVPTRSPGPDLSGAWAPTVQVVTDSRDSAPPPGGAGASAAPGGAGASAAPGGAGASAAPGPAVPEIAEDRPEVTDASEVSGRTATSDEPVGAAASATPDNASPTPTPTSQAGTSHAGASHAGTSHAGASHAGTSQAGEVAAGEVAVADQGLLVHEPTTPPPPMAGPAPPTVTVVAGDTLWSIAAAHLPAGATTQDVARAWPEWYAHNQVAIGSDPGLIRPGQTLEPPASAQSSKEQP